MEQKTYAVLCIPHAFLLRMHGAGVMHGYTCTCIAMHSPVSLHQLAYRSDPLYGQVLFSYIPQYKTYTKPT